MYDALIREGLVVDGTGRFRKKGDIAINQGIISEIGNLSGAKAETIIDARGKIVCPGFIDIHSHADLAVHRQNHDEILRPLVMQGITSFVGGNCGFSTSFIPDTYRDDCIACIEGLTAQPESKHIDWKTPDEFMAKIKKRGLLLNMGLLAGHGSLRIAAAGPLRRLLKPEEQSLMEKYLEQSMEMGCIGLSSGLQYFPGLSSDTAELVKLGSVLKKHDGVFTSHMRSYSHTIDNAIDEICEVGRKNDIRVEISHLYWQPYSRGLTWAVQQLVQLGSFAYNSLKLPIPIEKGLSAKIGLIEKARTQGVDISFDLVPTSQGFTTLSAFFPPYVVEGGIEQAVSRLKDKTFRNRVLHDIEHVEPEWPHNAEATWSFNYIKMTGWNGLRIMAVTKPENSWMEGKTFPEIGKSQDKHPFDAMCDLLIDEMGKVLVFHTPTKPDDPFTFRSMWLGFTHPLSMPVTDTILLPFGRPSHVFYDCFPRFIEIFVKHKHLLSLEEAVKKCTSLPAEVMNIKKRGILAKGYQADILIFDLDRLGTQASFYNPKVFPSGIETVIINGNIVVKNGEFQKGILAGDLITSA